MAAHVPPFVHRPFTGEGWLFASVNYRLSASSSGDGPGPVRYPTHEQDVVEAIAWLRDHSAEVGGDPNRTFLVGHSSGAFIASLISTDTSLLAAAGLSTGNVRCTASLDTEYDVAGQIAQGGSQELLYRNAFGDDPATWAAGSPITHTAPGEPRPRFLVFTRGAARRVLRAQDFTDALRAGGTPATVIDLSPISHQEVNRAVGRPGDAAVTPALMAFFRTCASGPSDASNASWTSAAHRDLLGRAPRRRRRRVLRLGRVPARSSRRPLPEPPRPSRRRERPYLLGQAPRRRGRPHARCAPRLLGRVRHTSRRPVPLSREFRETTRPSGGSLVTILLRRRGIHLNMGL